MQRVVRGWIQEFICWYLRRCGGAFHSGPYGPFGNYVKLMSDESYHAMKGSTFVYLDSPKVVADRFFAWVDEYHELQEMWDTWNASTKEDFPYDYFRRIAKTVIRNLVRENISTEEAS